MTYPMTCAMPGCSKTAYSHCDPAEYSMRPVRCKSCVQMVKTHELHAFCPHGNKIDIPFWFRLRGMGIVTELDHQDDCGCVYEEDMANATWDWVIPKRTELPRFF